METRFKISGMTCSHCVGRVEGALKELGGVTSVSVSLEDESAVVEHDSSVTFASMALAVEDAGYDVVAD